MARNNKGQFIKGEHASPTTEFKKGIPDYKHPQWKGDKVGYSGLHRWLYRNFGQPKFCVKCKTVNAKRFEWSNKSGKYQRDISDWERLCSSCHIKKDYTPQRRLLASINGKKGAMARWGIA